MPTYYRGQTFKLKAAVTDEDGAADPTTFKVTVKDADGSIKVNAAALTKDTKGNYYYRLATTSESALGEWNWDVVAVSGSPTYDTIEAHTFTLVARTTET